MIVSIVLYLERGLFARAHHTMRRRRQCAARHLVLLSGHEQLDRFEARRKVSGELGRDGDLATLWDQMGERREGGREGELV